MALCGSTALPLIIAQGVLVLARHALGREEDVLRCGQSVGLAWSDRIWLRETGVWGLRRETQGPVSHTDCAGTGGGQQALGTSAQPGLITLSSTRGPCVVSDLRRTVALAEGAF